MVKLLVITLLSSCLLGRDVQIESYNIWFDDKTGLESRYRQILAEISTSKSDIICLQEVTPVFYKLLQTQSIESAFHIIGEINGEYGQVIVTKHEIMDGFVMKLPSRMNRVVVVGLIKIEKDNYRIYNVHLDSTLEDVERRRAQLRAIIDKQGNDNFIIAGDFNFGDDGRENDAISGLIDSAGSMGFPTYDIENNKYALLNKFDEEKSRRLDRILVSRGYLTRDYKIHKNELSDHYRIEAKIFINNAQQVDASESAFPNR